MEEGESSLIMGDDHHSLGPVQRGKKLGEEAQQRHHEKGTEILEFTVRAPARPEIS